MNDSEFEKAKDIAWDECKFEGEDSFDACPFEMFKKGWQARGELDAVRIKEMWSWFYNMNQEFEKKLAELTSKIKVAEESELLALRNNDGLRAANSRTHSI